MAEFRYTPRIFKIGETRVNLDEVYQLMKHLDEGHSNPTALAWFEESFNQQPFDHSSKMIEVAGRMCYKSFGTGLNPNITRVRDGNEPYLGNILRTKHGSVLEHSTVTFALCNVSRVGTHELVRHRAGVGISQESMRFVRVENIRFFMPEHLNHMKDRLEEHLVEVEKLYLEMVQALITDDMPFSEKKKISSALRRILPDGILTDIVVTANHRAWRHMIEIRTAGAAEEEIRLLFGLIGARLKEDHPNLYQDMTPQDDYSYAFENSKI